MTYWTKYITGIKEELTFGFDSKFAYGARKNQENIINSIAAELEIEMDNGFKVTGDKDFKDFTEPGTIESLHCHGYIMKPKIYCFHATVFTKNIKKQCRLFCKGPFRITFETENIESDNIESNRIFSWGEFSDNNFQMFRKHTRGCYKFNDRDNYYVYCSDGKTLPKTKEKKNTLDYHYNRLFHNRHSRIFDTNGNSLISSALYVALKDNNIRNVDNIRSIKNNHKQYEMLYQEIYEKKICFSKRQKTTKHKERFYDSDDVFIFAPLFGYSRWITIKSFAFNNIPSKIEEEPPRDNITSDQFYSLYFNIMEEPSDKISTIKKLQDMQGIIATVPTKRRNKQISIKICKKKWIPWITNIYMPKKSTDTHYKNTEFSIRIKDYPTIIIDFLTIINKCNLIPTKINNASIQKIIQNMNNPGMQFEFLNFLLNVEKCTLLAANGIIFMKITNKKIKETGELIADVRDKMENYKKNFLGKAWELMLNEYLTFRLNLDEQIGFNLSDHIEIEILRYHTIKVIVAGANIDNMGYMVTQIRQKYNNKYDVKLNVKDPFIKFITLINTQRIAEDTRKLHILSPDSPGSPGSPGSTNGPSSISMGETKSGNPFRYTSGSPYSEFSQLKSSHSPGSPGSPGSTNGHPLSSTSMGETKSGNPFRYNYGSPYSAFSQLQSLPSPFSPLESPIIRGKKTLATITDSYDEQHLLNFQGTHQLKLFFDNYLPLTDEFVNYPIKIITDKQKNDINVVVIKYFQKILNGKYIRIHLEYYRNLILITYHFQTASAYKDEKIRQKINQMGKMKQGDKADKNLVILMQVVEKILDLQIGEFEFITDTEDPFFFHPQILPAQRLILDEVPEDDDHANWMKKNLNLLPSLAPPRTISPDISPDISPEISPSSSRSSSRAPTPFLSDTSTTNSSRAPTPDGSRAPTPIVPDTLDTPTPPKLRF